jgi:putative membrane protein
MMAWVRTAASMISFGFTIYKFFQLELASRAQEVPHLVGPRGFALILIGIGLGALVLAAIENRRSMQMLRGTFHTAVPGSIAGLVAALVAALGVVAILVVIFRQ